LDRLIKVTLDKLGIEKINNGVCTGTIWAETNGPVINSENPSDGYVIAAVKSADYDDYEEMITLAERASREWRRLPVPQRAEIIRQVSLKLREHKKDLGMLISIEAGKIIQEGMGEVQEMIDICDFALGQARLMNGVMLRSERPDHKMYDQYHPLGIVGIVTSFNFPMAVWAWNTMLAVTAGNVVVWKPSSKTPLSAVAVHKVIAGVLAANDVPEGVFNLVIAKSSVLGDKFTGDRRLALLSVTGSTRVGRQAAKLEIMHEEETDE